MLRSRSAFISFATCLLAAILLAATPGHAAPWSVALGTDLDEEGLAVAGARDGSILVAGSQRVGANDWNALAACLDRDGRLLWQTSLGGRLEDRFTAAAPHPEGGWLVAGTRNGTADMKVFVARLWPDGALAWERTWPGRDAELVARRDGSFVVATTGPGRLVAFNAAGYVLWRRAWQDTTVASLDAAPDGSLLVSGTQVFNLDGDWPLRRAFVAMLEPNGTIRWAREDGCSTSIGPVRLLAGGDAFVAVWGGVATLAPDGRLRSHRTMRVPRPSMDSLWATPSGGVVAAGQDRSVSDPQSLWEAGLVRMTSDLRVQAALQTRREGEDDGNAITMLGDASTVLAGTTTRGGSGDRDMFVMRLEPLVATGACDLTAVSVTPDAPTGYPFLALTLLPVVPTEVIQSVRDPVHAVAAEIRPPCSSSSPQ